MNFLKDLSFSILNELEILPVELCNHRCSRKITGLLSAMLEIINDLASLGKQGITTFNPGMELKIFSRLFEHVQVLDPSLFLLPF